MLTEVVAIANIVTESAAHGATDSARNRTTRSPYSALVADYLRYSIRTERLDGSADASDITGYRHLIVLHAAVCVEPGTFTGVSIGDHPSP